MTGAPLIDWSLNLALESESQVVVISRKDKTELNNYIKTRSFQDERIQLFTIDSSLEWPDSILQAQGVWGERNLVLLPDTRFDSLHAPKEMLMNLNDETSTAFAAFRPDSFSSWGVIRPLATGFQGCEKPVEKSDCLQNKNVWAWGFFAFKKAQGLELLKYLLVSTLDHSWYEWKNKIYLTEAINFVDLARDKRLF